ncbi:hypothetical protein [Streptomyces phaeochromogenes]|uniref:hypothetical protein n=1 Tax=Streptomyces phaeochromogenes TaxID=1923 RepID=UPI0033FD99A9
MGSEVLLGSLLADVEVGVAGGTQTKPPADDEWGVLRLSAMSSGRFTGEQAKRLAVQASAPQRYEVRDGDVLMVRVNGAQHLVGAARSVTRSRPGLLLSDLLFRIVPDGDRLLPGFLDLLLSSHDVRRQMRMAMRGSSGQFQLPQAAVRALEVPNVSPDQQRRIVAAHAAFAERVAALEGVAAKRAQLLDALVEQLLGACADETVSLAEADVAIGAGITLGAHRVPHLRPAGYLRVANVRKGWIEGDVALLEAMERDHQRYALRSGDLLVVEGHADPEQIGRCAVVGAAQVGLLYQNHLFRLRFDDMLPEFAMLWLNSRTVRSYWTAHCATSSGLYTVNSRLLEGVPFPRVSRDEQERVVGVWKAESRAASLLKQRIDKLRTVQQAVVEDLLTGRSKANAA